MDLVSCLGKFHLIILMSLHSELPSFLKTPMDLTIRTGAMAKLECAAEGHPPPQISWQKDGGIDFPAARERRMHVMPEDDVFFIVDVKIDDMGIYSCMAQNLAGGLSANATLTVLGKQNTGDCNLNSLLEFEGGGEGREPVTLVRCYFREIRNWPQAHTLHLQLHSLFV